MVEKVCARTGWFTILLCALGTAQASAQNAVSQELLELSEDQRSAAFPRLLRASDQKRDQVIRTLFAGAVLGLDDWEALCRSRNSYSLNPFAGLAFTETSLREKGRTMANETRSRQENTPFVRTLWCGNAPSSARSCVRP